jgi:UDP-N-acetylmuramoylalanine--D-glutamate ligase
MACPQVWVLELSSFQLDGVDGFEPERGATVLNLTQDHLDWHGTMDAYAAAKARVFGHAGADGDQPRRPAGRGDGAAAGASRRAARQGPKVVQRRVVRFGLDAPQRPGDFGLVVEQRHGLAGARRAAPTRASSAARASDDEIHLQRLMPADALRIRGRHNAANALAALALATAIGCPLAPMLHGLREYAGEPHRVEFIASVGGVEAFDDSKGTNVGATVAALKAWVRTRRRASWW